MSSRKGGASKKGTSRNKAKSKNDKSNSGVANNSSQSIDEFETMDSDELQEEIKKYNARVVELRRSRNYYQLERDQIQQFHDIVHEEVQKTESHIRNIETQMERMQDVHRNAIRIYLQKVIHLEYEHGNNVSSVNQQSIKEREEETSHHLNLKTSIKQEKLSLKSSLQRNEFANEDEIKKLKESERKEMQKLREQFERNHSDLQLSYENRLQSLRDDLELRRKMEIHEIQERKNRHINDLMMNHDKNFTLMRNYYNSITQDNLDLIRELNNEIEDLKVAHAQNEKAMEQIEKKNQSLSEPLAQAEARVKSLKHKLQNYHKDKESLRHARARLLVLEEQHKSMQEQHHQTLERFAAMEAERDELVRTFEECVLSIQKRSQSKNIALEKMLDEYKDMFEVKKAQFTSVLRASNLDPVVLQNVTKKLDDVVSSKYEQIHELNYEIAKAAKAHNDLVRVYEAKLKQFGIPSEELNIQSFVGDTNTAPADLLVA